MAAAALVLGGTSMAKADDLVGGDNLTTLNGQSKNFGTVSCNSDASVQVVVALSRSQGGVNAFKNGSTVTVSAATNAPMSVPAAKTIKLPSDWEGSNGGTKSAPVTFPVTVSPTASGSGTVTFTAKGTSTNNKDLEREATVTFTWSAAGCSTDTSVALTCPDSVIYTGSALTPCSATLTPDGLDQPVSMTYSSNTNVGTATVTASYAGDATHNHSSAVTTFQITQAPSTVSVTCHGVTYDGSAQTPCSAEATGRGDVKVPLTVTYDNNTDAGTATASATWAGDTNHEGNSGSANFTVAKASSTVTVRCDPQSVAYDGTAHTDACSATVAGAGGLKEDLSVTYDPDNVKDVGTVKATASYDGGPNHTASEGSATFAISPAASITTITCSKGPQVFDGEAHTPCTAEVTGVGGLKESVEVSYENNVKAGTAKVTAHYAGDRNHDASVAESSFEIGKAQVQLRVSCTQSTITYDGVAHSPCSATVTGPDGLSQQLGVSYGDNVNAGMVTASAHYEESDNYLARDGSATFEITKATSSIMLTCRDVTFDATAQEPCEAAIEGAGVIDTSENQLKVDYVDNTNAGDAQVSGSWEGDRNHTSSSATRSFKILKAGSEIQVVCDDATYSGQALEPCTASVDGIGGVDTTVNALELIYTNNVNAGTGSVVAVWDGDDNHDGTTERADFMIAKAPSEVAVSCVGGTFTGAPLDLCSATVAGVGLNDDLSVSYEDGDNVNAGTRMASASYPGDSNHEPSQGEAQFTIAQAASQVRVECDVEKVTFDGEAHDVCLARVTGAALDHELPVSYDDNMNAGTVTASASFGGDRNHTGSKGSATFAISPAASVTTISCSLEPQVFDGSAHTPCTAEVTGVGGLKESVEVSYENNVDAGTATVTAHYAGDRNHDASHANGSFEIGKAAVEIEVTCSLTTITYNGTAHTPCSATVTGPAELSNGLDVNYSDNVNVGMVTASAHYAGSDNYLAGDGSATFEITKATSSITISCPSEPLKFTGSAQEPCTATPTGVGVVDRSVPVTLTYSDNTKAGQATVTATWPGDKNHERSDGTGGFTIAPWSLDGYERPVEMGTASTIAWNSVKGGSTVPLKFGASAYGRAVTSVTELGATFSVKGVACPGSTTVAADLDLITTGGTELRAAGGRFIQNWQTPKVAGACYLVTTTTADGSSIAAYFKLK
jgi:hypothetical protein